MSSNRTDHYAAITDRIVEAVERALAEGTATRWTPPWSALAAAAPRNAATERRYRGVNALLLGFDERNGADPRWCTYRQAAGEGWQVRKGAKAVKVYLFKPFEREAEDAEGNAEVRRGVILRTFNVFHASDIEGIPAWEPPVADDREPWEDVQAAERVIKGSGARIEHGGDQAFYRPSTDTITVPVREAFADAHGYYGTVLHELSHWTGGSDKRVPRREGVGGAPFGSPQYAREEIRADMASAILRGMLGIADGSPTGCQDTVAYVRSWLRALADDKYEARRAIADAQRIADFLLGDEDDVS